MFRVPSPLRKKLFDGDDLYNIHKIKELQSHSPTRFRSPVRGLLHATMKQLENIKTKMYEGII